MKKPPVGNVDGKKEQVEQMFDSIAHRYDLINRVLSLGVDQGWRRRTIELVCEVHPKRVLDVATGTADLALQVARKGPDEVVGVDIAEAMLQVGREKIVGRGLSDVVSLHKGDAENLDFSDSTFDAVMVAFGVRNFENLQAGLREMRRVLRPSGRLVVLEFSQPQSFPMKQAYNAYNKFVLPRVGGSLSGNPGAYSYLPESVQAFPYGDRFLDELRQAEYTDVSCEPLTFGIASIYVGHK